MVAMKEFADAARTRQLRAASARNAGRKLMQPTWVCCNTELPRDGAPIRFLLDDRMTSIRGRYSEGLFLSRWASYDPVRVMEWCAVDINPAPMPVAVLRTANNERPLTLLKQLNKLFAHSGDAIDASHAPPKSYSNQMSA